MKTVRHAQVVAMAFALATIILTACAPARPGRSGAERASDARLVGYWRVVGVQKHGGPALTVGPDNRAYLLFGRNNSLSSDDGGLRATFRYTVTGGQLALEETATGNGGQAGGTTLEGSCAMEVSVALTSVEYGPRIAYSMANEQLSLSARGYQLALIRTQGPPPGEPIAAPTPIARASSPGSGLDAGAPNTVGPLGSSTPLASGSRASC
jgi:hypothetical protein